MIKRIIISGSEGFIGNNLKDLFIKKGYEVYGIDKKNNLQRIFKKKFLKNSNYKFFKINLSSKTNILKVQKKLKKIKFDSFWHFAANSDISKGSENIEIEFKDTFLTTKNSLEIARMLDIEKFVFASSSAIFGNVDCKISEEYGPCLPKSNYGAMKLSSEGLISTYSNFFKKIVIARFPNVVGVDNTHGLIFDMLKKSKKTNKIKVLGNGFQKKPYIHVFDLVDILFKIYKKKSKNMIEIYNVGPDDSGITVRQIIQKLSSLKIFREKKFIFEKKLVGWIGDIPRYSYDIKKLKKILKPRNIKSSKTAINMTINQIKKITE